MAARRRIGARLALATGSALLTLLAVEVGLRIHAAVREQRTLHEAFARPAVRAAGERPWLQNVLRPHADDRIVYELKPDLADVRLRHPDVVLSTNARGFRGPPLEPRKPSGCVRVAALGDSIAFGWGVAAGEAWPQRLVQLLREAHPGRRIEVINTGVPGYNTAMEVAALREKVLPLEPDVVVIGFVANDLRLPNFIRAEVDYFTLGRSFLFELVAERAGWREPRADMRAPEALVEAPLEEDPGRGGGSRRFEDDPERVPPRYRDLVGWASLERALDELAELSASEGFAVVAFAFHRDRSTERMLELAAGRGFATVRLAPRIEAYLLERGIERYRDSELSLGGGDPHPSALGHELAARELCEEIGPLVAARF